MMFTIYIFQKRRGKCRLLLPQSLPMHTKPQVMSGYIVLNTKSVEQLVFSQITEELHIIFLQVLILFLFLINLNWLGRLDL